jgi:hypothetical protein
MALTHEQNALLHSAYGTDYAESTSRDLRILAQLDMSCAVSRGKLLYAQVMEAYSRNALLYSDVRHDSEGEDARNSRLDRAILAAVIGLELARQAAAQDQPSASKPFSARIAPNEGLATREALQNNLKSLRALREE